MEFKNQEVMDFVEPKEEQEPDEVKWNYKQSKLKLFFSWTPEAAGHELQQSQLKHNQEFKTIVAAIF